MDMVFIKHNIDMDLGPIWYTIFKTGFCVPKTKSVGPMGKENEMDKGKGGLNGGDKDKKRKRKEMSEREEGLLVSLLSYWNRNNPLYNICKVQPKYKMKTSCQKEKFIYNMFQNVIW